MRRRDVLAGVAGSVTLVGSAEISGSACDQPTPPQKGDSVTGLCADPIKPVNVGIIGL